ncbi:MAG: HU family DNA-binding protein [Bacteroides sp.]|nr:HU family DNA-binding protein [Bacteroides sp.]
MSLKTVVTKRVFGFDPTKAEKYVVRSVVSGKISNKKLLVLVSQICGAHRGIVQQVVAGVIDAMVNMLEEGMSVELGDFGTFRPAIRAKAADTRADATANTIYRRRIVFTPGEALRDMLEKTSIQSYSIPDTDYTDGTGSDNGGHNGDDDDQNGGNGGNDGGGGFIDPAA